MTKQRRNKQDEKFGMQIFNTSINDNMIKGKAPDREELARLTDEFLANGGVIEVVPSTLDDYEAGRYAGAVGNGWD